ncbi:MAG: lactate utilization protein [Synergistota bacterium]|nr:lactate utilization protein [Synergistota bacterium]
MNSIQEKNAAIRKEFNERLGVTIVKALDSKGFKAQYAANAAEAVKAVLALVPDKSVVGIPGTSTVRELELPEELAKKGCRIVQHWDPSLAVEDRPKRWKEELASDVFVTSANAVTHDGMLVNIDGTGNRVAGMAWADNRIIFVVGINKVSRDLDSAEERIRDVATPLNAMRLDMDLPCVKVGYCVNCDSPQRACRATLVLERAPFGRDAHVILVGENLGY